MFVHVAAFLRHGRPPVFYWGRPVGMFDFPKLQLASLVNAREMEKLKTDGLSACQCWQPWHGARPQSVAGRWDGPH